MPLKPQIANYGDSFSKPHGDRLYQRETLGEIISSGLNRNDYIDNVTFSKFEKNTKAYILGSLGAPTIRVELTDLQIKIAIDESISKLYFHLPNSTTQMAVFMASAGENVYELPQYILDNLTYVVYKRSLLSAQASYGTLEFDVFLRYFTENFIFSDFQVGEYLLMQMHLEMIRKVLGNDGSWDVINNKWLQIYPVPVITPDPVIVQYRGLDSDTLHPYIRNWLHRYALAKAKTILGAVRGKYKVLPGPGGGATLDGDILRQEGKEEMQMLEQQLMDEIEEFAPFSTF
jgi:hypothetical protein